MGLKRIIDLPLGTAPTGSEIVEVVQNGISVQLTVGQIVGLQTVNMRQFKSALVTEGVFYDVNDAIPADPANLTTIQWMNGESISTNDALYTLVQTTLGYTGSQMAALLNLAATQPR